MVLVRFIRSSKEYSFPEDMNGKPRFKYHAVYPLFNATQNRQETSCLQKDNLKTIDLRSVGTGLVGGGDASKIKGFVEFNDDVLKPVEFSFEKDGIGHANHGNILGWPTLAGEIANKAKDLADAITSDSTMVFDLDPKKG